MRLRESSTTRESENASPYSHNVAEANRNLSTLPDARSLDNSETDCEVRSSLVCGDLLIMLAFPMTVRGREASGVEFEEHCVVDRLGSRGVCTHLQRPVALGATLFVLVQLSIDPTMHRSAPSVAAQAVVNSLAQQPDGSWHTGLAFTRHRFIYAS